MKINRDFEMAVKTINYFKRRKKDEYIQSHRVAKDLNYSPGYLHKVVLRLGQRGIVHCKRGANGGLKISQDRITLYDVWKATYGDINHNANELAIMKKPLRIFAEAMDDVVLYDGNSGDSAQKAR